MKFRKRVEGAFSILTFDKSGINRFSKDKQNTKFAYLVLLLVAAAISFSLTIFSGPAFVLAMPLAMLIIFPALIIAIWFSTLLYHSIAKIFGGKASLIEYYRTFTSLRVVEWILAIPLLGFIFIPFIEIWITITNIFVIKNLYDLESWKAILVVLIPMIIMGYVVMVWLNPLMIQLSDPVFLESLLN